MEENIADKRKENHDLSLSLKKLKQKQNIKTKELQTNNIMKKYPTQINSLTDEIKNIMGKKQDFLTKISNNKKSLNNLRSILSNVEKNYNNMITSKGFQKTVDNLTLIKNIDETIKGYRKDLDLPEAELMDKINKFETFNKFSVANKFLSSGSPTINRKKIMGIESINMAKKNLYAKMTENSQRNKSINNNTLRDNASARANGNNNSNGNENNVNVNSSKVLLPKILNNNSNYEKAKRSLSPYKGIFNKYEYLNKKDKSKNLMNNNNNKKVYGIEIRKNKMYNNNLNNNKNKKEIDRSKSNDDLLENSGEGKINFSINFIIYFFSIRRGNKSKPGL